MFDQLEGMKYIPEVPLEWFMDYVPDVPAFKESKTTGVPSYVCDAKIRRVKPFYISQFEDLKRLTRSDVRAPCRFHSLFMLACFFRSTRI